MRHAVYPGSKGAPAVKSDETPPEPSVNILEQVAPFFGICLISTRQAVQRRTIDGGCLRVQLVLAGFRFYV